MLETSEPSKALNMSKTPLQVLLDPDPAVSESEHEPGVCGEVCYAGRTDHLPEEPFWDPPRSPACHVQISTAAFLQSDVTEPQLAAASLGDSRPALTER